MKATKKLASLNLQELQQMIKDTDAVRDLEHIKELAGTLHDTIDGTFYTCTDGAEFNQTVLELKELIQKLSKAMGVRKSRK